MGDRDAIRGKMKAGDVGSDLLKRDATSEQEIGEMWVAKLGVSNSNKGKLRTKELKTRSEDRIPASRNTGANKSRVDLISG